VPIAVDAAHLSGPDPSRVVRRPAQGEVRLVSTGRLHWCKGLEHGMMALRELLNRGVACRWRIVGEGPYRAALECAVRDLGLGDVVSLVGARDAAGIREELLSADVMFHPTVADAISNSVLEGMALGLPVVAGDAGGIREGVRHGETGLLIPPRDWRAMADALEVLARNPDLRARMGAAGREAVLCRFTPRHQDKAMAALLAMVGGTR
jgi:glycosyltransferase involved in cell wall biosynthesis